MSRNQVRSLVIALVAVAIPAFLVVVAITAYQRDQERGRQLLERYRRKWIDTQLRELQSGRSDLIHFYDTERTDDLLKIFEGMPEVCRLGFELTDLSHEGLKLVAEFPNLRELTLYGGRPSANDQGLQHLQGHNQIEVLQLINTDVTDSGLEVLATLPKLRALALYRDGFREVTLTDDALLTLRQLNNLEDLNISGGWVSDEAVRQLQADMPNCKITTELPEW